MTQEQMESRLKAAYPDCDLVINDLTGTADHWEVRIASSKFKDLSRIQKHRAVMDVFAEELKTGEVHALTVKAIEK
ncbi:MAG: BolA/IbaG family iron-sulfur metabolism protein [Bdellovibrionales bacterium]